VLHPSCSITALNGRVHPKWTSFVRFSGLKNS
jgi:hypothetical protein